MKIIRNVLLTFLGIIFLIGRSAAAEEDWFTLETQHFLIHYQTPAEPLAKRTANIAEQVHKIVTKKLSWVPREKTHLVLSDSTDYANAFVIAFPYSRSVLFLSPPITDSAISLFDYDDWWTERITHEYAHVVHIDKGHGFVAGLRNVFGRVPLFFPNALNVPWVTEGLATHYETDDEAGIGRGQSSYFKMLMRAELAAGFKPVNQVNLPISTWPVGRSRYLYGVYFFRFLESRYGEGASERFIQNYSDNFIPWRIGGILEQETGKEIDELWEEYRQWLEAELSLAEEASDETQLTQHGYFTRGLNGSGNGDLFYIRDDQLAPPALMRIGADGHARELVELHADANIDVQETSIAVTQPEICGNNKQVIYYDLYLYRFSKQKLERITECQRLIHISWHPDGKQLAAVQLKNAGTSLVLVDTNGAIVETLWQAEDGVDIAEVDWSPDGKSIVAARHHRGRGWNIELLDIENRSWRAITRDEYVQAYPRFSLDGNSVLFASEASGKFQTHIIDLQTGQERRLTSAYYGAFSFTQVNGSDKIYYAGYTSNGFDLFESEQKNLSVTQLATETSVSTPVESLDSVSFKQYDYSPWSSLLPRWWLPHLGYTSESLELGIVTGGNDALGKHVYAIALAYDFENSYPLGSALYAYKDRFLFTASSINDFDFDDGDVERIRREDSSSATFIQPIYSLDGSWLPFFGLAHDFESDRFTEDDVAQRRDETDNLAGVGVVYISARQRARAISPGDGRAVKLVVENSDLKNSDFSGNTYTLDWREYYRLGGTAHVLGLRYVHGWGEDDPRPFRLGDVQASAGIQGIFDGQVGPFLNQRRYILRGYDSTSSGRRMQLATVDWRFPIANVERGYMSPPIGLLDLSGTLFVESGATWNDGGEPDEYRSAAGVELHAETNWFYLLNLNLRLGYAHGFDEDGEDQVYLNIGAAF